MAKAVSPNAIKKVAVKKAVKKTAVKKTAKKAPTVKAKKEPTIKYADKSAGQPELIPIFEAIKEMFLPYDNTRALKIMANTYGQATLISHKPVEMKGKMSNELWFLSVLIQKGYVGFYSNPFYLEGDMKKEFSEGFAKSLKGKSCFHIKKMDPVIIADIQKAVKLSYDEYVKQGLI